MKRVKVLLSGLILGLSMCFLGGCGGGDEDGGGSSYYMQFKYNGKDYRIASSILAQYTRDEMFGSVSYILLAAKESISLQISVFHELEAGNSYDIICSTPIYQPDITITISSNGKPVDDSYYSYENVKEKIGELTITKITEKAMEGKFYCKTNEGEVTDGKFKLRYDNGMGNW
jgi:hypothetical protein